MSFDRVLNGDYIYSPLTVTHARRAFRNLSCWLGVVSCLESSTELNPLFWKPSCLGLKGLHDGEIPRRRSVRCDEEHVLGIDGQHIDGTGCRGGVGAGAKCHASKVVSPSCYRRLSISTFSMFA